uniref:Uncharacterized protein LOC112815601 n=1 Tax=Callorhinus ursinus TaxID=34884 RepID=A0A3Q7NBI8_CALUR|nr:uncharacterized protein LOC112815601 [Callorhinus ursinus]
MAPEARAGQSGLLLSKGREGRSGCPPEGHLGASLAEEAREPIGQAVPPGGSMYHLRDRPGWGASTLRLVRCSEGAGAPRDWGAPWSSRWASQGQRAQCRQRRGNSGGTRNSAAVGRGRVTGGDYLGLLESASFKACDTEAHMPPEGPSRDKCTTFPAMGGGWRADESSRKRPRGALKAREAGDAGGRQAGWRPTAAACKPPAQKESRGWDTSARKALRWFWCGPRSTGRETSGSRRTGRAEGSGSLARPDGGVLTVVPSMSGTWEPGLLQKPGPSKHFGRAV